MSRVSWQHALLEFATGHAPVLPTSSEPAELRRCRRTVDTAGRRWPRPRGVAVTPAPEAPLDARWLTPTGAVPGRVLVYLHGGGYVVGSADSHQALAMRIAKACRLRVLLPDYPLAPEHPCPAALDAIRALWRWLMDTGWDPAQAVLAGDSAGGGLTLATMQLLRNAGQPLPAAAVLLSPSTDSALTGESLTRNAQGDAILALAPMRTCSALYRGPMDARDSRASPLFGDLSGLPPLLVHVSRSEMLLDDSLRLADRVREAGGHVSLEVWDGLMHDWHFFAPLLPEANAAIRGVGAWVRAHLPAHGG